MIRVDGSLVPNHHKLSSLTIRFIQINLIIILTTLNTLACLKLLDSKQLLKLLYFYCFNHFRRNWSNYVDYPEPSFVYIPTHMHSLPLEIDNRCHVIGGGPTSDIRVHIGKRELTADMQLTRSSTMTGNRCMRREQHSATKWSEHFEATSNEDQASLNCSVAMAPGQLPVDSREVVLHVRCKHSILFVKT